MPTLFFVGGTPDLVPSDAPSISSSPLARFFDPSLIHIVDRTIEHRSSRGYLNPGDWKQTRDLIQNGDIVLFQFADSDPGIATDTNLPPGTLPGSGDEIREIQGDPGNQPEIIHTYGWYLRLYVVETIARGAIPILCSTSPSLNARRAADLKEEPARKIAAQQRVAFLDLIASAKALPRPTSSEPRGKASADVAAHAIISALKGLPNDPLAGYFSPAAESIQAFSAAPTPNHPEH